MARLDPSPWNLGAPLVGVMLGACGPLVPVDGTGDTGTTDATTNPTGPNPTGPNPTGPNPTGPNPTSATTSTSCYDIGCPPGYHCENGYCVYDGCYYDDGYGCCYDTCCGFECGWYGECFSNVECPIGYACQYNYCQPTEQELECEIVVLDFDIPLGVGGNVRSLAFMNGDGDAQRDLVIGQAGSVLYAQGSANGAGVVEIAVDVNAEHLATGDLDNDGDDDIVIANAAVGGGILVLQNDGNWTPFDVGGEAQNLRGVALADIEGDGFRDIWAWSDTNGTFLSWNNGGWMISAAEYLWDPATSLAVGDADGDVLQDTAIYSYQAYVLTDGPGFNGWGLWDGSQREDRQLVMANFNGAQYDDLVTMQSVNGVTMVSSFAGPVTQSAAHHSWWQVPVSAAVSADMNVDGYVDIVGAAAGSPISIAFGAPENEPDVINCVQYVSAPISAQVIAVGDLSGDGRPDLAVSDGDGVVVMMQSG